MTYEFRNARLDDEPQLHPLIARSIRALGADDYPSAQIEAALKSAFGVDTSLIRDGTFFVALTESGQIVACGGWSSRKTLFGSDTRRERDESRLDPRTDPAKIRAFFVDPDHARRGLGRAMLELSEAAALRAGFTAFELMATLPGVRLYQSFGYVAGTPILHPLGDGISIRFVPMRKRLSAAQRPA